MITLMLCCVQQPLTLVHKSTSGLCCGWLEFGESDFGCKDAGGFLLLLLLLHLVTWLLCT